MVGGSIYHGRRFNIPWWEVQYTMVGGSIYHGQGVQYTMDKGLLYHGQGVQDTLNIPLDFLYSLY